MRKERFSFASILYTILVYFAIAFSKKYDEIRSI